MKMKKSEPLKTHNPTTHNLHFLLTLETLPELANALAPLLSKGSVVTLSGTLGAGKTTFARMLIQTLAGDAHLAVTSPTFTIVQEYTLPHGLECWHYDFYRLESDRELDELGLEDALKQGICVIEWPEIAISYLPEPQFALQFDYSGDMTTGMGAAEDETRMVTLTAPAAELLLPFMNLACRQELPIIQ